MIEKGPEVKIYHNNNYNKYGDSLLIYTNGGGVYLSTINDPIIVMQKRYYGDINIDNIDQYAFSRNFRKVLESDNVIYSNNTNIIWYNNYESYNIKISSRLEKILLFEKISDKRSLYPDPYIIHFHNVIYNLNKYIKNNNEI